MIKDASIQAVRDKLEITEVVSEFVKLNRHNTGKCPFHTEKSASFHVYKTSQTYKCFGCGAGGDAIRFLMEHEKLDFIGAIQWLADFYHLVLEHEDPQQQQRVQQQLDEKKELQAVVTFAHEKYQKLLNQLLLVDGNKEWAYIKSRGYNEDIAQRWGFGFAPDEFHFLSVPLVNAGRRQPGLDAGLLRESKGQTYDFYRNRIIIPIHDIYGQPAGIAGRWLPTGDKAKDDDAAKYYNPPGSVLYNKSKTWFGLYQAITAKAFARQKDGTLPPAFIVEGYFDVISWHEREVYNTLGACGTAITSDHVRVLKRYTNHVVFVGDGDSAGVKSMLKSIDLFLEEDFKVEAIELPKGMDPHDYAQAWQPAAPAEEEGTMLVIEEEEQVDAPF